MKFLNRRFKENRMTLIKALAAASLVLASAQAMAFTPPYHINGTPLIGAATFKSSGACKVAPKKFANAQFGSIYDSTNASVGTGVIDATGNAILAVANSNYPQIPTKYNVNSNTSVANLKFMLSFIDNNVLAYIVSESGCAPGGIWTLPNSYYEIKQNGSVADISIKQSFTGNLYTTLPGSCKEEPVGVVKCNLTKFSGGMTFKARTIAP
jgi:hypothetical protein